VNSRKTPHCSLDAVLMEASARTSYRPKMNTMYETKSTTKQPSIF
jgi:hypothetical protein